MPTPLDRFFEAAGCKTQVELADFLGIRQSSIADAKKRGTIPSDWLLTLWRKTGVNPDWILTAQGEKLVSPISTLRNNKPSAALHQKESRIEEFSIEELLVEAVQKAIKLNLSRK